MLYRCEWAATAESECETESSVCMCIAVVKSG